MDSRFAISIKELETRPIDPVKATRASMVPLEHLCVADFELRIENVCDEAVSVSAGYCGFGVDDPRASFVIWRNSSSWSEFVTAINFLDREFRRQDAIIAEYLEDSAKTATPTPPEPVSAALPSS